MVVITLNTKTMNKIERVALKSLRLSTTEGAKTALINNEEVNIDSNGKAYCMADFQEFGNGFSKPVSRMIRLDGLTMKDLAAYTGKVVPHTTIYTVDTEPYFINGNEKPSHTYTCVIIGGFKETLDSVLTKQGIVLKGEGVAKTQETPEPAVASPSDVNGVE